MSRRTNRVEEACREELSEILVREIKDPRVGFVTITKVKVTEDLGHARVYVSILGSESDTSSTLAGLESAKGYLRSCLGKHLRLRHLPEIEFVHDTVTDEAMKLMRLMEEVRDEGERPEDDG